MNDLSQNLRARVCETLALIASEDAQRKYQREAPHVNVPAELFNQWEDSYHPEDATFQSGFRPEELATLTRFNAILDDISGQTPQHLPPLSVFIGTVQWQTLSQAARVALGEISR